MKANGTGTGLAAGNATEYEAEPLPEGSTPAELQPTAERAASAIQRTTVRQWIATAMAWSFFHPQSLPELLERWQGLPEKVRASFGERAQVFIRACPPPAVARLPPDLGMDRLRLLAHRVERLFGAEIHDDAHVHVVLTGAEVRAISALALLQPGESESK